MQMSPRMLAFMEGCAAINDEAALRAILQEMTRELGFKQHALLHHVDLTRPPAHSINVINYEEAWLERIMRNRYFHDDPVLAASNRRLTGFGWREVPDIIRLSRRQRQILEEARLHGLLDGFTVPVQVAGEYRGTCSFGSDQPVELTPHVAGCAQLVAVFCFEAARRIARQNEGWQAPIPELTQRQLDCLVIAGSGKTNWEISRILGVSEDTVRKHIMDAMRRYGVSKRTMLIVRALFDGYLSYRELLRRQ